jgi:biotin synthase
MDNVLKILQKVDLDNHDIIELLSLGKEEAKVLFEASHRVKLREVGNLVYFRGLIELSNVCVKDCFYCGIRHSNSKVEHYGLSDSDVLHAARFAWENRYGSVVIQAGELSSEAYVKRITRLIGEIKELSHGQLGITLSLGEQNEAVYRQWFNAGAHRYLLRIETTNRSLYGQLHPANHSFQKRLDCLNVLKDIGYQVGTGVMIGLPFQTVDDLADDLLFMKHFDVDMVGMGPYIEHADTPLYEHRHVLWPLQQRFDMSLKWWLFCAC